MKRVLTKVFFSILLFSLAGNVMAGEPVYKKSNSDRKRKAAGCSPATERIFLELNNVRTVIYSMGSMWVDNATNAPKYEVPKGSGQTALYAGALWMGGMDINNQLKLAAIQYRDGDDFWTGPLSSPEIKGNFDPSAPQNAAANIKKDHGSATIDPETCLEYDNFFVMKRQDVITFRAWYNCQQNPDCDASTEFPNYVVPESIENWPAHGDASKGQDFYVAPFFDNDGDGAYNPGEGDYPWYDLDKDIDCRDDRRVTLFGDQTMWWIFNDKGNIHTETQGLPIGMEIRAQAFAFNTNDEINSMTFYNYELINRSTQTLTNTYFGQWVDPDLGCQFDDYVGCDVQRGLGYCYNGKAVDGGDPADCNGGYIPYGSNPPAIGVDFFEGPYQDNDAIDNPLTQDVIEAIDQKGIPYEGIGIGYGDGVADNERFGMRRFVYYNNSGGGKGDPSSAEQYYNYLSGFWKFGQPFRYGGDGFNDNIHNAPTGVTCDFIFPGDSDPLNFGTLGTSVPSWDETNALPSGPNPPDDRRFLQSAGPFTLEPGALNNITVGVVYARSETGGDLFASVRELRIADDKAQRLFDACFEVIDGPDAPDLAIQELDKELILVISNPIASNNYLEQYAERDQINIVSPPGVTYDDVYEFQGYQIFQLKDETVSAADLANPDLARLVAQCDIEDSVSRIINYPFDTDLGAVIPTEMVNGENKGVRHSFKIVEDAFAQGNRTLVNHKKYHYMAIAYSFNEFKKYTQDPVDPVLDGQTLSYLASRKSAASEGIAVMVGIPHNPNPEVNGTQQNSDYGDLPRITRVEGQGNGGYVLNLTTETEERIILSDTVGQNPGSIEYEAGFGPIQVKVVDPLNVVSGDFELRFLSGGGNVDTARWQLTWLNAPDGAQSVFNSENTISIANEQIIPELGISVFIEQYNYSVQPTNKSRYFTTPLESQLVFKDSSKRWLGGIPDQEGFTPDNWIRSGASDPPDDPATLDINEENYKDHIGRDDEEIFENIIGGTWAPFFLTYYAPSHQGITSEISPVLSVNNTIGVDLSDLQSIDIVFTADKDKWTRVPVIEVGDNQNLNQGKIKKLRIRAAPSKDKDGNTGTSEALRGSSTDQSIVQDYGMSYFPGYAIDLETGERLNMAFGEDSWIAGENGRDMIWNPTSNITSLTGDILFAGKHYIYVFRNDRRIRNNPNYMPAYDEGAYAYKNLSGAANFLTIRNVFQSCMWLGWPKLNPGEQLLSTEARVKLRVSKPYEKYNTEISSDTLNGGNEGDPIYLFSTDDFATQKNVLDTAVSALDQITAVPNPYLAYNAYETDRLDNRMKITNLPERCTISIYTVNGTLIKQIKKDDVLTSVDWNLKNQNNIPIAGGIYIIHVDAPGIGEKVIKWLGVLRPPDLENF